MYNKLTLTVLVLLLLPFTCASAPAGRSQARPGCTRPRVTTETVVYFAGWPNLGGINGGLQVALGDIVVLHGKAEVRTTYTDCSVNITPLAYSWRLNYQPRDGAASDVTGHLNNASTLLPNFTAVGRGTYILQLITLARTWTMPIEVIRPGMEWAQIGPDGTPNPFSVEPPNTGRVNVIAFDPDVPSTLYVGGENGGVFRSTNRGAWWEPVSDHKGWPNLAVSALTVPAHDVIYAGVGGPRHGFGSHQPGGAGIMKSLDGGVSWQSLGLDTTGCPADSVTVTDLIYRIIVNPQDSQYVYAGGNNGLFLSTNGGQCWRNIGNFGGSATSAVTDIAFKPGDPNTLYVAELRHSIFKSTNAHTASPAFNPLHDEPFLFDFGRILLATTPLSPTVLYATYAWYGGAMYATFTGDGSSVNTRGVRSDTPCNDNPDALYCDYAAALLVKPDDADRVFSTEVLPWQSLDGMRTWSRLPTYPIHADVQALAFAPDDPNMLYAATDGGIYRIRLAARDALASQTPWEIRNQNLAVAEGGTMGISPIDATKGALGRWDEGSTARAFAHVWRDISDSDGYTVAMDGASANTIYYMPAANAGPDARLSFNRYQQDVGYGYFQGTPVAVYSHNNFASDLGSVMPGYAIYADPRRGGRVLGVAVSDPRGANPHNDGKLYVTDGVNTGTRAHWACADPSMGNSAALYSLDFALDGTYFASYTNGDVYRFSLPATLPANITGCTTSSTAAQGIALLYHDPYGHAVRIAVDPFDNHALYAVVPADTFSYRVLRLAASGPGTWTATPLGGSTVKYGLPSGVDFGEMRRNHIAFAADPIARGTLWLGTTLGLYMGEPLGPSDYAWTLDPYVPETQVTEIVPQRTPSGGFSGVLQLATYGRSIWERNPVVVATVVQSEQVCEVCYSYSSEIMPIPNASHKDARPPVSDRYALLTVPYDYDGSAGSSATLQVSPLSNGKAMPYFSVGSSQVKKGSGMEVMELAYDADDLPLGQFVDTLQIELLENTPLVFPDRPVVPRVISNVLVPFDKLWLRDDARSLSVEALARGDAMFSTPVSFTVQLGKDQPDTQAGHFVMPVPQDMAVTLTAPEVISTVNGDADLVDWIVNGLPQDHPKATILLNIGENTQVAALYDLDEEGEEYFPRPTSAFMPIVMRKGK